MDSSVPAPFMSRTQVWSTIENQPQLTEHQILTSNHWSDTFSIVFSQSYPLLKRSTQYIHRDLNEVLTSRQVPVFGRKRVEVKCKIDKRPNFQVYSVTFISVRHVNFFSMFFFSVRFLQPFSSFSLINGGYTSGNCDRFLDSRVAIRDYTFFKFFSTLYLINSSFYFATFPSLCVGHPSFPRPLSSSKDFWTYSKKTPIWKWCTKRKSKIRAAQPKILWNFSFFYTME